MATRIWPGVLSEAAVAAGRTDTFLGECYRRVLPPARYPWIFGSGKTHPAKGPIL
jgi:hypothetical protein